jgi:hypothetical protein
MVHTSLGMAVPTNRASCSWCSHSTTSSSTLSIPAEIFHRGSWNRSSHKMKPFALKEYFISVFDVLLVHEDDACNIASKKM